MTKQDHPEYMGLMADVIADPKDATPRLIVADWLDDHGQHDHAAFVRFQVANPWAELTLKDKHQFVESGDADYISPRPTWLQRVVYRRGFIDEVQTTLREWMDYGPDFVRRHPATRVEATDKRPYVRQDGRASFVWGIHVVDGDESATNWLPVQVGRHMRHTAPMWWVWESESLALNALSAALLAYARQAPVTSGDAAESTR